MPDKSWAHAEVNSQVGMECSYYSQPRCQCNETKYVVAALKSTFVSSVGQHVNEFERKISEFTGAHYVVATNNGTAALIAVRKGAI